METRVFQHHNFRATDVNALKSKLMIVETYINMPVLRLSYMAPFK